MTDEASPHDAALAAVEQAARASAAAMGRGVDDLDDLEHGPLAVRSILAHASALSAAVHRLSKALTNGRPAEPVDQVDQVDLDAVRRFIAHAKGTLAPCPSCGGLRPAPKRLEGI